MANCEIFSEKDMLVVVPEGEMDSREYPEMENTIIGNILPAMKTKVIFNMGKVDSIDGDGVIFLLRMKSIITANGGYMMIYSLNQEVERTINSLLPDKVLNHSKNVEKCFIDIWFLDSDVSTGKQACTA
jgi:anti-anti-sigma factor